MEMAAGPLPERQERKGFFSNPWYVVGLLACLGLVSIVDRIALSLLIEPLKGDLGISDTQAGLLIGPTFAIVYTLSAMPIAWGLDRGNRKWIAIAGITLWSLSTTASAFVPNFEWLFVPRMGVGVGEAVLNPVAVSLIGDLFVRERRATPTSVFFSSLTLGGSLSFLLVAAIVAAWTNNAFGLPDQLAAVAPWRVSLFLVGVPGLFLAALMALTFREPERGRMDRAAAAQDGGEPVDAFPDVGAAARFYVPFLLGINLIGMMQIISVSWIPTFLIRTHQATIAEVGLLFGNALLVACLGSLAGPMLAERLALRGRKDAVFPVLIAAIPVAGLCIGGALSVDSLILATILIAAFHLLSNSVIVMPSVVISSIGGANSRARLVAAHLFVQAIFAYTLGPVLVPMLSARFFDGLLGPSILAVAGLAFPLAVAFLLLGWGPYRRAVRG